MRGFLTNSQSCPSSSADTASEGVFNQLEAQKGVITQLLS